jgi:transcription antitermination factor NusG
MKKSYKGANMSDEKRWHSWVIKRNRIDNVISFIKDKCPEIDKYFYPQIKKEYQTKKGIVTKDRPLYEGYLFLRYNNHPVVFHKLSAYPQITTYAGPIHKHEIDIMREAQGKLISEIKASRYKKGDIVVLLSGPFKGFEADVSEVTGDVIKVEVRAKLLGQSGVEMIYKEDQIEHKSELEGAEVQDL